MNSTKGQMYIAGLAIFVISLVVLILVFKGISTGTEKLFEEHKCRTQVLAHAATLTVTGKEFATTIDCPTQPMEKLNVDEEEETKKWIAESMRKCWFAFAEGEYDLFKDEYVYCHPCYTFDFEGEGERLLGLSTYLSNKEMPGKDRTYMEYLQAYKSDRADDTEQLRDTINELQEEQEEMFGQDYLDATKDYATLFVYAKGDDNIEKVWDFVTKTDASKVALIAGGTIGMFTGAKIVGGVGTGIGIAMATTMLATNPIGWSVLVAAGGTVVTFAAISYVSGAVSGALTGALAAEVLAYHATVEAVPERISMILVTELTPERLEKLNCEYEPIPIKTS